MKDKLNKIDNFYTPKSATKLVSASMSREGLVAEFVNGLGNKLKPKLYSWRWVRDHCIDPQSLDQGTTQRKVNTFALAADLMCTDLDFSLPEQLVHFSWDDGSRSSISAYVLATVVGFTSGLHELTPQIPQVIWDKDSPLLELPRVEFDDVIQSDKGLLQWLQNIHVYGFSLVAIIRAN
jgi:trimethyllysine dioxygenase